MGFKRLKRNGLKKLLGIIKAKRSWAGKAFGTSLKLGKVWEKQHTKNDSSEDSVSGDISRDFISGDTSEDSTSEVASEDSDVLLTLSEYLRAPNCVECIFFIVFGQIKSKHVQNS